MIAFDVVAPIMLMFGLKFTTSSNASLLNNFEIVATSIIAFCIFKESISKELWIGIFFITISSVLLTIDISSFTFSWGSLLIILASICWGFENNCTKKISNKSTYEIVMIKGIVCGITSMAIALFIGEKFPILLYLMLALLLGFIAYGLSIFFYIKAQNKLGAAKTSAFYAINPFLAVLLSLIMFNEIPTWDFYVSLLIMLIGTLIIVLDTLKTVHNHTHQHIFTYTYHGIIYTKIIEHNHTHSHINNKENHNHHSKKSLINETNNY